MNNVLANCKHILIIKLRYLGDSIWMLPFVENLKRNLPNCTITVLVNEGTEAFFKTCPAVSNIVTFPRKAIKRKPWGTVRLLSFLKEFRKLKPDAVIEMTDGDRAALLSYFSGAPVRIGYNNENRWRNRLSTHTVRSKMDVKHMVDYQLDILRELGMTVFDDRITIPVDPSHFESLNKRYPSLASEDRRPKIVVHPGARNSLRQWGADNFASLCDALSDRGRIILVAGPDEGDVLDAVAKRMKSRPEFRAHTLTLFELAALCELADIYIGNDTGPLHIASAKTFVVGLYGPTLSKLAGPWTENKLIFESPPLYCRPCRQEECVNEEFKACLNTITPQRVAEKVGDFLSGRGKEG